MRFGEHSQFVALPPAVQMRALVFDNDADERDRTPYSIVVDSSNARAESMLGYLTRGALESARSISEAVVADAETLLHDKRDDASGAVVGGYFLLKAGRAERRGAWIKNLADWFPWLPDGAVIDGWRLLKQSDPQPEAARDRLIEIPLFTYGLRLLFNGLNLMTRP